MRLREDRWAVWDGSDSAEYAEPPDYASFCASEHAATEAAHKMAASIEEHGYLEYGIQVVTVEEQERALRAAIEDAEKRLKDLKTVGYQCPWYL